MKQVSKKRKNSRRYIAHLRRLKEQNKAREKVKKKKKRKKQANKYCMIDSLKKRISLYDISDGIIHIVRKNSKTVRIVYHIQTNPSPGSYGDYLLLKNYYIDLEALESFHSDSDANRARFDQLIFNTTFLQNRLAEFGELHCEYCGKQNLVIYDWRKEKFKSCDGATCDHKLPKSLHPELSKDENNCAVACEQCNKKKKLNVWNISFPYYKKR